MLNNLQIVTDVNILSLTLIKHIDFNTNCVTYTL